MAAFSSGMPDASTPDTGVVGRYEQQKALQRARLAGYASDTPYDQNALPNTGANPALSPPSPPMLGTPPAAPNVGPPPTPLANGTIVTKPTLAVLGESGSPEMVVPLNNDPGNKTNLSMIPQHGRYRS